MHIMSNFACFSFFSPPFPSLITRLGILRPPASNLRKFPVFSFVRWLSTRIGVIYCFGFGEMSCPELHAVQDPVKPRTCNEWRGHSSLVSQRGIGDFAGPFSSLNTLNSSLPSFPNHTPKPQ